MPRGIVRTAATVGAVKHIASSGKQAPAQPAAQAPQASGGMTSEQMAKLQELAKLRDSGVLTEEEFQTQKERILTG